MTPETAAALREPFPADLVGKLPRIWCGSCRDARSKACTEHAKKSCTECQNKITTAHLHLDYVGHADVTDRLLQVDPQWTWEPLGVDERGLPAFDALGGLWLRLTVCGVSRLGYGHADGKRGGDAVKEAIGDGIRNAALRFGVALDLWRREKPAVDDGGVAPQQRQRRAAQSTKDNASTAESAPRMISDPQSRRLHQLLGQAGHVEREARLNYCRAALGRDDLQSSKELTLSEAAQLIDGLQLALSEQHAEDPA